MNSAIEINDLHKTFHIGLRLKKIEAVKGISFNVGHGEIFGFLGPNGAGKTTTIKILTGLLKPTRGTVRIFGKIPRDISVRARTGFLPEQPYFYDYLKPVEIMNIMGMIFGIPGNERKKRINYLIDLVGLAHATDRTLRKLSKGMVQRIGIAQALINDPELVILDEPLSGLDPVGRKEIRDIIFSLKKQGKTVFFSSHILSDIEMICDKVAIIDRGRLKCMGDLDSLLNTEGVHTEVMASNLTADMETSVINIAHSLEKIGENVKILVEEKNLSGLISMIMNGGGNLLSVTRRRISLEELLVKEALQNSRELLEKDHV
jgi:ABC-2 type transport system ATP-binding protein